MLVKVIKETSLARFESACNTFIAKVKPKNVSDIKLSVQKEFLPHTTAGEYIETYYGLIIYKESKSE